MRACGNYGYIPLKGKPCGLASEPGGMTQRSCVYFGARYVLGPIKEAIHLVHGPVGCAYYGTMVRGEAKRLLGTALGSEDIIFGGLNKLKTALREAFVLNPSARGAFVYATCSTGLIGEDFTGLAQEFEKAYGRKVMVIDCPGFSGKNQSRGHTAAYKGLLNLVRPAPKAPYPTVNLIGEYNVAGEALAIKALLKRLGIRVHTAITGDTSISEIERLSCAHLNLLFCGSTARAFAEALEERFGIPYIKVSFYGLSAVRASLRKIAEALGLFSAKVEELIAEEEKRVSREIRPFLPLFEGKRALIVLGAARIGSWGRMLKELGLEIIGAASIFGKAEDHQEAAYFSGFLTDDPGDDELEKTIVQVKPDLLVTNAREQWRAVKLGCPTLSLPQERRRGPYTGYQGFLNLVRDLARVLGAPVWRLKEDQILDLSF